MVDDIVACGAARYAGGGVRMSNGFGVGVSYEGCHWYGLEYGLCCGIRVWSRIRVMIRTGIGI